MTTHPITEVHFITGSDRDCELFLEQIKHMNPISLGEGRYRITTQLSGEMLQDTLHEGLSEDAEIHVTKLPLA